MGRRIYSSEKINANPGQFFKNLVISTQVYLIHEKPGGEKNLVFIVRPEHSSVSQVNYALLAASMTN